MPQAKRQPVVAAVQTLAALAAQRPPLRAAEQSDREDAGVRRQMAAHLAMQPAQSTDCGAIEPEAARPGSALLARALRTLARREHTRAELRRKLQPHAADSAQLETTLESLEAKGFLSDERAAASLVRQKASRYGLVRIRQELLAKGLTREQAQAALEPLQENEWHRAQSVWQAKFSPLDLQSLDWQERRRQLAKQARFMLNRGFPPDVVQRLVRGTEPIDS